MVKLNTTETRNIINDRLNSTSITNTACCARMGNGIVSIFRNNLDFVKKGNDLYILVPETTTKTESGEWLHNIESFVIYRFDESFVNKLSYSASDERVRFNLDNSYMVYDTSKGEIAKKEKVNDQLSALDMACLMLRLPETNTQWINDLIIKRNKIDSDVSND